MKNKKIPLPLFNWRLMLSPVAVDYGAWVSRGLFGDERERVAWRGLYIFGVRLAVWRDTE